MDDDHELIRTFRPELTKRILAWLMAAFCAVGGLGPLVGQVFTRTFDGGNAGFALFFVMLAVWCSRMALMHIVADERGIEMVDVLRRRDIAWTEIDRFETTQRGRGDVVFLNGKRLPLIGYVMSPIERVRRRSSPTENLVEELNLLLAASKAQDSPREGPPVP